MRAPWIPFAMMALACTAPRADRGAAGGASRPDVGPLVARSTRTSAGADAGAVRVRGAGTPPAPVSPTTVLTPSRIALVWEGRIDRDRPDAPRFAWPASGFRLRFHGTELRARMRDALYDDEVRDTDFLAVYVDDRAPRTIPLREGEHDYVLASGLDDGPHEVRVLKRTESEAGTVTLLSLGGVGFEPLPAPPIRSRRLLAIGDSITAGYGIDGPDAHCHYSAGTSNATRTYTFLASQELEAEYQAIAWSGRGVYRNIDPELPETMPELFERRLATEPSPRFRPSEFVPDVVVVNLGTNDLSAPRPNPHRYADAMRRFVQRLRQVYPRAQIVLAVGPMLADDYPPGSPRMLTVARYTAKRVVQQLGRRGDTRLSTLELYGASPDEGYGCDYHPSLATHRRLAEVLAEHVEDLPTGP